MAAVIDPEQPLPIYAQLKTLLLEEILSGRYGDDRLPTEHELCAYYEISRTPVHRALAELAEEGVILRQRRRGTFVNPHWVRRNRNRAELRIIVPEGPWEALMREACPAEATLNVATVELDDLHRVLIHAVAAGRAPDLALLDSVWVPEFAASGFLLPLDELDEVWLQSEYLADAVDPFRDANRLHGMTFAVQAEADVVGLWYRRDALTDADVAPPSTWGELAAACRRLAQRNEVQPLALPAGSRGGESTTYCLMGLLAANGASVIEDGQVTIDSAAAAECLEFVSGLVADGSVSLDAVGFEHDRVPRLLAHRQAVFGIGGSYELRMLAAEARLDVEDVWKEFGFVPTPRGPSGRVSTLAGGMVHGIFRQAVNPQLAMKLLKRLSSADAQAQMSLRTGQVASRRSAAAIASRASEFLGTTAAMLDGAVVRPAIPTYPRVSAQLQSMLESVLVGRSVPREATARAAELISAITGLPVRARL